MKIDVRQASHPEAAKGFDTAALRRHFLIESLFQPDEIALTYSHIDRLGVGGAMPLVKALELTAPKPIGTTSFMARRELGVVNIGGAGRVQADGAVHHLDTQEALYVAMGSGARVRMNTPPSDRLSMVASRRSSAERYMTDRCTGRRGNARFMRPDPTRGAS